MRFVSAWVHTLKARGRCVYTSQLLQSSNSFPWGKTILLYQQLWPLGFPCPGQQHGTSSKMVSKMKTSQCLALLICTYDDNGPMWSLAISPPSAEKNKGPSSLKQENRCSRTQARRRPRFTHGCWNQVSTSNFKGFSKKGGCDGNKICPLSDILVLQMYINGSYHFPGIDSSMAPVH